LYGHSSSCDATGAGAFATSNKSDAGRAKKFAGISIMAGLLSEVEFRAEKVLLVASRFEVCCCVTRQGRWEDTLEVSKQKGDTAQA
jgi:hypothetical protein